MFATGEFSCNLSFKVFCLFFKVFVCYASSDCVARRCVWMIGRPLFATHLALGANVLALVTKDGEAFTGIIPKYSQPLSSTTRAVMPGKGKYIYIYI